MLSEGKKRHNTEKDHVWSTFYNISGQFNYVKNSKLADLWETNKITNNEYHSNTNNGGFKTLKKMKNQQH